MTEREDLEAIWREFESLGPGKFTEWNLVREVLALRKQVALSEAREQEAYEAAKFEWAQTVQQLEERVAKLSRQIVEPDWTRDWQEY